MNRLIILHFSAYSGGKFIANCLSLSKYAQPMTLQGIDYLTNHPDDYEYRLGLVLQTLPPSNKMDRWLDYEFDEGGFYKDRIRSIHQHGDILFYNTLDHFLTEHSSVGIQKWLQSHTEVVIITLTNVVKFQRLAHALKDPNNQRPIGNDIETQDHYESLKGGMWPNWKQFERVGYNTTKLKAFDSEITKEMQNFYPITHKNHYCFNIDDTIFYNSVFLDAMHELYKNLGYTDFNERLVDTYWAKYISLHIGETNGKTV